MGRFVIATTTPSTAFRPRAGQITLEDTQIVFTSAAFCEGLPDITVAQVMRAVRIPPIVITPIAPW